MNDVELWKLSNGHLTESRCDVVPQFPTKVWAHQGIVNNDAIMICGGYDGGYSRQCYQLKKQGNQWTPAASMGRSRWNFGMAVVNGQPIAIGGFPTTTNTGEKYEGGRWTAISNSPVTIKYHCAAEWSETEMIVIGGIQGGTVS